MLDKLKLRVECYDTWCEDVSNSLDVKKEKILTLSELKALLNTALDKKFPQTEMLDVSAFFIRTYCFAGNKY